MDKLKTGTIGWVDLTVPDADSLRDFYSRVTGWQPQPVDMGGYSDYVMATPDGTPAGGVCHARGTNQGIPPVWMIYITVADLDQSLEACLAAGGAVVRPAVSMGAHGRFAVIRDPAGAVCALFQAPDAVGE